MEIARATLKISWRIEPNPAGGYIARCSDPAVPPLEGATQAELQQKIRDNINGQLAAQFPDLKIGVAKSEIKAGSLDLSSQPTEGGIKPALESWAAKNIAAFVEGKLPPELAEQLKAQAHDGKLRFTITTTTTTSRGTNVSAKVISAADAKPLLQSQDQVASNALPPEPPVSASFSNSQFDTGSPIVPASSSNGFLRFLVTALALLGLFFLLTHLKK